MVEISKAVTDNDMETVKELCWEFRDWLEIRFADHSDAVDVYYHKESYSELLESLPVIHAPPGGCILIAKTRGDIVGCAMIQRLEAQVCELKRMYVTRRVRGQGIGEALLEASVSHARQMGYDTMRLDTGAPQREAYALYKKHGFVERSPYYDPPAELADICHFMERSLR